MDAAVTSSDGKDASDFPNANSYTLLKAVTEGYLLWLVIKFPLIYEVDFFLLSMHKPQFSITVSIRNATNIADNFFCTKLSVGELVT